MSDKREHSRWIYNDKHEYQRLFEAPETCGIKSGRVWLAPAASTVPATVKNASSFFEGTGTAMIEGQNTTVGKGKACYIPPETEYNILNTGTEPLIYIFIFTIAPTNE